MWIRTLVYSFDLKGRQNPGFFMDVSSSSNLLMLKQPVEGADNIEFLAVGVVAKVAVFVKSCLIVESALVFGGQFHPT
ncbi:hypothetical protein OIU85_018046 [Salix viminalis]|uniref:Uncharacterized protein n=1 Tax=Salix viminalis TaxID=40686 RepID=A0A9Q0UU14_SALVM|nr:hypothetical protein OIU85_018046 [Salix viminalis]